MTATTREVEQIDDPEPREIHCPIISVDDHLVEPPDMFEGRLPARLAEAAPRVVLADDGAESWFFDGTVIPQKGANAVVGQKDRREPVDPMTFEDMRRGAWDVHARVRDMDIAGIWGSLNFPSVISGFCGRIFSACSDPEIGFAVMRAWNDWMVEEWCAPYPDRMIPLGITWLRDPVEGAREIRRNASRGVHAVTLPELPHRLGYPSLHSAYWDPILAACEETDTVICLHIGSSGKMGADMPADAAPGLRVIMFPLSSFVACCDWLWSGAALRFPKLKILMAEGGIGWVPMMIDRLDFIMDHGDGSASVSAQGWASKELKPSDVLRRNFYFAALDDKLNFQLREHIGVDHIMAETDYPHGDSTWPDSQRHFRRVLAGVPRSEVEDIMWRNAARVFRTAAPPTIGRWAPRGPVTSS